MTTQSLAHKCLCSFIHSSSKLEQPKCPPTDEWISKSWYIHALKSYSGERRRRKRKKKGEARKEGEGSRRGKGERRRKGGRRRKKGEEGEGKEGEEENTLNVMEEPPNNMAE